MLFRSGVIIFIIIAVALAIFILKAGVEEQKNIENKNHEEQIKIHEKEKARENVKYLELKNSNNIAFTNGTIIHCLTEDDSNFILNLLENYGYTFYDNSNLTENCKVAYNIYKENTCYKILDKKIYIRDLSIFKETYIINSKDVINLINNNDKIKIHII